MSVDNLPRSAPVPHGGPVRAHVAAHTHAAHMRLHVHPQIGRLTEPDVSAAEYLSVLAGFLSVFEAVEARRAALGAWPELTARAQLGALEADLAGRKGGRVALPRDACAAQVLGMLYALHGAQFGGLVIHRNLQRALPALPHRYFGLGPHKTRWRNLLAALEQARARAPLVAGAQAVFEALDTACGSDG